MLPDGLYAIAEVVEDVAALNAAAGREEATDNAGDVTADVEHFRIVHADAFHAEAEAANAWKHHPEKITISFAISQLAFFSPSAVCRQGI